MSKKVEVQKGPINANVPTQMMMKDSQKRSERIAQNEMIHRNQSLEFSAPKSKR